MQNSSACLALASAALQLHWPQTAEPRFTRVCPVLAGGDLNTIISETTERHLVAAKEGWTKQGHTLAELMDLMKTVDPLQLHRRNGGPESANAQRFARRSHSALVHRSPLGNVRQTGNFLVRLRPLLGAYCTFRTHCRGFVRFSMEPTYHKRQTPRNNPHDAQ